MRRRLPPQESSYCFSLADPRRYEAKLEISSPLLRRVGAIVQHRAVHPHFVGARINTEWIGRPQHYVGVLSFFERANLVIETERPCGIECHPLDRLIFRN